MSILGNVFEFEFTDFLKIYYDFAYFLCLCPFQLVKTKTNGCSQDEFYIVKSWWLQKYGCTIIALLGFPWLLRDIRVSIPENNRTTNFSKRPTVYFEIILGIVGTLLRLSVIKVFWYNGEEIGRIVNFLAEQNTYYSIRKGSCVQMHRKPKSNRSIVKLVICSVCFLYTAVGFLNWVMGRSLSALCYEGSSIYKWDLSWWWTAIIGATKYSFFMESNRNTTLNLMDCTGTASISNFSTFDTTLGVVGSIGFYFKYVPSNLTCLLYKKLHFFTNDSLCLFLGEFWGPIAIAFNSWPYLRFGLLSRNFQMSCYYITKNQLENCSVLLIIHN